MNSTYNTVLDESVTTWKFQRLGLVLEFAKGSVLPAPLSIFEDLWALCSSARDGSSHGAGALWAATAAAAAEVGDCTAGGYTGPSPAAAPAAAWFGRGARDWFEWLAQACIMNQERTWARWPGFFPPGWDRGSRPPRGADRGGWRCLFDAVGESGSAADDREEGSTLQKWRGCPCERCQARILRGSADAVGEALEAWARTRAEGDRERSAAVEAARVAAATAARVAEQQAERVAVPIKREGGGRGTERG
jgi:hypothetical protein